MPKQISLKIVALSFGVLTITLLAAFYVIAWQEPTQTPPQGNVAPPINTSTAPQAKSGILSVTQLNDTDNPSYYLNPSGSSNFSGSLILGGTISATNIPLPQGLYGQCERIAWVGGGPTCSANAPAYCENIECVCPGGYTSVKTGMFQTANGVYNWFACYKN